MKVLINKMSTYLQEKWQKLKSSQREKWKQAKESWTNFPSKLKKANRSVLWFLFLPACFYFIDNYLLQNQIVQQRNVTNSVRYAVNDSLGLLYGLLLLLIVYLFVKYQLRIWALIKLAGLYVIYCSLSYLISMTLNINNPKYRVDDFDGNHFWQGNFLVTLSVILGLALLLYVFKFVLAKKKIQIFKPIQWAPFENLLLSQLFLAFILTDTKMPDILYQTGHFVYYNLAQNSSKYTMYHFWMTNTILLILIIVLSIAAYLFVKGLEDCYKNRSSFSLAFFFSGIFAVVFSYFFQISMGEGEPFLSFSYLPGALVFQVTILLLIYIVVYVLLNRILLSTFFILFISTVGAVANAIKFEMRNEPILPSDLNWLKSIDQLFSYIDASYTTYAILLVVGVVAFYFLLRTFLYKKKIFNFWPYQLVCIFSLFFIFNSVYDAFTNKSKGYVSDNIPVISVLNNFQNQNIAWLGNATNARYRSLVFVWINQLATEVVPEPDGYSRAKIAEIEKKYDNIAREINQERTDLLEDHTVVYILSESFSDPARIDGVSMSRDPIPNIHTVQQNTTSGLMKSDGYGGGTANMEYQTLMGLPFYNMSQSVSVLYSEVFPKMKETPAISNFYNKKDRIVIHLSNPDNFQRRYIYQTLDYNKFISSKTKGLDVSSRGFHASDESTYNLVLNELESKPLENQFMSVMTMQNHSPWSSPTPEEVVATGVGYSEDENFKLTNYTRLLTYTDTATQEFLEKLEKLDKRVTVVFYGDHLPGFYPSSAFAEHPESQYLTDYFIWSNYETPKRDYPLVNSSDFSALVLEETNSKVSPYYALLTEVLHKASVDKKELDAEGQEIAEDLKMIEYDMINGRGYLSQDFFKLPAK